MIIMPFQPFQQFLLAQRHFETFYSLNHVALLSVSVPLYSYAPARCLSSADQMLLEMLRSKVRLRGAGAISVAAASLRSDLPLHITQAPSVSI